MTTIFSDIVSPDVTLWGSVFKLVLSMLLGSLIGFERRLKGQRKPGRELATVLRDMGFRVEVA